MTNDDEEEKCASVVAGVCSVLASEGQKMSTSGTLQPGSLRDVPGLTTTFKLPKCPLTCKPMCRQYLNNTEGHTFPNPDFTRCQFAHTPRDARPLCETFLAFGICPFEKTCWLRHVAPTATPLDKAFDASTSEETRGLLDDVQDNIAAAVLGGGGDKNDGGKLVPSHAEKKRKFVAVFTVLSSNAARVTKRLASLLPLEPLAARRSHGAKKNADMLGVFLGYAQEKVTTSPAAAVNFRTIFAPAAADVHLAPRLSEAPLVLTDSASSARAVAEHAASVYAEKGDVTLKLRLFPSGSKNPGAELLRNALIEAFEQYAPQIALSASNSQHTHQLHCTAWQGCFLFGMHGKDEVAVGSATATATSDKRYIGAWGRGAEAWGVVALEDGQRAQQMPVHNPRIPPKVCRAYEKLEEATKYYADVLHDAFPNGGARSAIDIGAAPGGWTLFLAESLVRKNGGHVIAVDPAALDSDVASHERVSHVALRLEDGLDEIRKLLHEHGSGEEGSQIVTCDANFRPSVCARALLTIEPLLADGAIAAVSLKNFVGREPAFRDDICVALAQLTAGKAPAMDEGEGKVNNVPIAYLSKSVTSTRRFRLLKFDHLFANSASERTAILRLEHHSDV